MSTNVMMLESNQRRVSLTSPDAEIQFITPKGLQHLLDTSPSTVQVVDCRSFLNYNTERIIGSVNVYCPPLVKKRFQTCLPLSSMLSSETKTTLVRPMVETVVLHDQCTNHALFYLGQSDLPLVFQSLRNFLGDKTYMILNGGFCSFHNQFPKYCSRHTSFSGQLLHAKKTDALMHSTVTSPGSIAYDLHSLNTPEPKRKLSLSPVELLPYLYIGDAGHSTRKELLLGFKISAILNVSTSCENHFPTDFRYKVIPVEDSHNANLFEWFQDAILFIERERRAGGKVLVHCHGGISRSATVCLAYLMFSRHLRLDDAFDYVRARRNVISPNANFMMQLSQFETELRKLGVCWPEAWSKRYPSSSSSTTTEEDMSWDDRKNRLESSSSTTSSEFSWQGTTPSRGTADTVTGQHCPENSLLIPTGKDLHAFHQEPVMCCQNLTSPRKSSPTESKSGTNFDGGSSENKYNITCSEKPGWNLHLRLKSCNSEDVFLQPPQDPQFLVCQQAVSPNTDDETRKKQLVQEFEAEIVSSHFSPPPKSPSLNFGCLLEQSKTSSQNFFFGSCPDITQTPSINLTTNNANERSFYNNRDNDVFSNGSLQVAKQHDLNIEDEEDSSMA
ncbi:hypothetical protein EGW08_012651 [Elysia chlorotica]|uniref:protein-tyrosine-phosphatase n=1 Tax=Elysia chlorotica TaxID=188477 RepID=A0A3S1C0H0_ELYCH|nr:hypothetical protein EGW08_012651 [Elysia chlorotica]